MEEETRESGENLSNGDNNVKVNCSYCGKEIECPVDLLSRAEKHACFDCFSNKNGAGDSGVKVHVDIPLIDAFNDGAEDFAGKMSEEMFPKLWAEHKSEIKEMTKRELAEKMFKEGLYMGFMGVVANQDNYSEGEEENDKR